MDSLALEAVVRPDGQLEIFDRQSHVGGECGVRRGRADLDAFGGRVQLAGESEQFNQGRACRSDGVAGQDGVLGLDVDNELVEVGALLDTSGLHTEGHLQNG